MKIELGKDNIHKVSNFFSFYDHLIPILSKDLVNQRWRRVNLQCIELIFLLQIEQFLVQLIDLGKKLFLDLILVKNDAQLTKRRIVMCLTKLIFKSIKI